MYVVNKAQAWQVSPVHTHIHTIYIYCIYTPPSRSYCGKHTRQSGRLSPERESMRACLTSLIGFFSARSQGDEKLYQAEIINFALTTRKFADTSLLSENEEGGMTTFFFFPSSLSFFSWFNPSISFFFSKRRSGVVLTEVMWVLYWNTIKRRFN